MEIEQLCERPVDASISTKQAKSGSANLTRPGEILQDTEAQLAPKFFIVYRADSASAEIPKKSLDEDASKDKNMVIDNDLLDRKILYECENVETATYIVAKIKAQM